MQLNTAAPTIQWITYALLLLNFPAWVYLARLYKFDRDLIAGLMLVNVHAILFYTTVLFFFYPFFNFTNWSQWLRFHTWATMLLIVLAMIWRKRKVEKLRKIAEETMKGEAHGS